MLMDIKAISVSTPGMDKSMAPRPDVTTSICPKDKMTRKEAIYALERKLSTFSLPDVSPMISQSRKAPAAAHSQLFSRIYFFTFFITAASPF